MIEFVMGFMLSIPTLIGLLVVGLLFEHNDWTGTAIFLALVATVTGVVYFDVSWQNIAYGVLAYAVAGVVWSFYRYKRFVSERVATFKANSSGKALTTGDLQSIGHALHPAKNIGSITAWIMVWPFSLVDNLISDAINTVQTLIKTVFRSVYTRIYDKAMADLVK